MSVVHPPFRVHDVIRHVVPEAPHGPGQIRPAFAIPHEELGRFGQELPEHDREHNRHDPAQEKEGAPAVGGNDPGGNLRRHDAAKRNAHNRQRHGKGPLASWDILRGERRSVRHGAPEAHTREEPKGSEHLN